jgi:hypothetical protein
VAVLGVGGREVCDLAIEDPVRDASHVTDEVLDQPLARRGGHQAVEVARLDMVVVLGV